MRRFLKALMAVAAIPVVAAALFLTAKPAAAASLTRVTNFGANPSNLNMYIYVPNNVAPRPALLVAIHYCTGSASAVFNGSARDYVTAADRYGYVIVFPEATRSGQCFDVYSPEALRRGGGSDPVGIMSMVNYAKQQYNVDSSRVYVTGFSSGAMMTNVMAAEYPDVFAAGSAFMGVPATCFATGSSSNTWNSQCSGGQISKTAQQWGDAARAMYPGYSGRYPRMQLWHGVNDTTLNYNNFGEEIKQWTNLNGVSQTPVMTDHPQSTWTRTRYGSNTVQAPVEGISVSDAAHDLPRSGMVQYAIDFLGLAGGGGPTGGPTTTPPTTTPPTTTPPTTTPPTSPPPGNGGGCTASVSLNSWNGGFVATVRVTAGSAGTNGWTVNLTLPSGAAVTNTWNAQGSGTSGAVRFTNVSYNGRIAAGQSTEFGFQGTGSAGTLTPTCTAS
ncbi:PHB depolymerase family esterase [Planosporangium sp. 12N6]|uniref:extracellular catalytic domain type 1 short-chain-length polyhydroxyalkanoate depolymerase n=1 Tax=Planosporangium spinosum TaxID=3402278 RepID=UPI003CF58B5C